MYKVLKKDEKKNTKLRSFEALEVFFLFLFGKNQCSRFALLLKGKSIAGLL